MIRCQGSIAAAALNDSVCRQLGDSQCEVSVVHSHYSLYSDDEFKDACKEKYRETVFRPPKRIRRDAVYDVDTVILGDTMTLDSSNDFSSDSSTDSDAESEDGPQSSTTSRRATDRQVRRRPSQTGSSHCQARSP